MLNKPVLIYIISLFLPYLVSAQVLKQKVENLKEKKDDIKERYFEDTSSRPNYLIYPTLAYTPETKLEVGFVNLFLFYAKNDKRNRLSEVNTFTFYTFAQQYGIWFDHAIYGDKDHWFFLGKGKVHFFPLKYYGIGIDAPEFGYKIVNNSSIQLRERVLRKIKGDFYGGIEFDYHNIYNVNFEGSDKTPSFVFPNGANGSRNTAIGAGLVYDNRRNVMNVRKGLFAEVAYLNYANFLQSDYTFNSIQVDARLFRPGFGKNQVWAFQTLGTFNHGNVPFNQLALMGGETMMRGYYLGRFRDKNMACAQAEYRFLPFPFSKRFGASTFMSIGTVAPAIDQLHSSTWKLAGGAGLRYLIFAPKDIFMRLDLAFTGEGTGVYLFVGEAF